MGFGFWWILVVWLGLGWVVCDGLCWFCGFVMCVDLICFVFGQGWVGVLFWLLWSF